MNEKDACTFFDKWLSEYSDHLHMVRQGRGIDLAQPESPKPPVSASADETLDLKPQQPKSSA